MLRTIDDIVRRLGNVSRIDFTPANPRLLTVHCIDREEANEVYQVAFVYSRGEWLMWEEPPADLFACPEASVHHSRRIPIRHG